jgi:protein disulfide-isomerase A6
MEKMTGVSADELAAALARLENMRNGAMKPELKVWILQRMQILTQIQQAA